MMDNMDPVVVEERNQERELVDADLESTAGTITSLNTTTETRLPEDDDGSETNYVGSVLDGPLEQLINKKLLGTKEKSERSLKCQNWVRNQGQEFPTEETANAEVENSQDDSTFEPSREDIEKMGALLAYNSNHDEFHPNAWIIDDQLVPTGNFKEEFIEEIERRLGLALMNIINVYCAPSESSEAMRYLYQEVLLCAAKKDLNDEEKAAEEYPTFQTLMEANQGKYFSDLKLCFKKKERISKQKLLIVQRVEQFVNKSVESARNAKSAVIFTGYALIPNIVDEFNKTSCCPLSPDQVAKCGLHLQKCIYQEMVDRCLDFLSSLGFDLRVAEDVDAEHVDSQASLDSFPSSQNSTLSQSNFHDVVSDSNAQGFPIEDSNTSSNVGDVVDNVSLISEDFVSQGSPGSPEEYPEYLRGDAYQNSPEGSMDSSGSYRSSASYSPTPPSFSLPERDRSRSPQYLNNLETIEEEYIRAHNLMAAEDLCMVLPLGPVTSQDVDDHHEDVENGQDPDSDGAESIGEPRPRRPRLDSQGLL